MRMFKYTIEQKEYLIEHNYLTSAKDLAIMFNDFFGTNLTPVQIKSFRRNNHLNSGLTGRFEKGSIPFNKGKKWKDYVSVEGQVKSRETTFKKGNKSYNCNPIGTEKWKKHNKRDDAGFLYVKIQDGHKQNNWKQKHRLLWESIYGPIPKGYKLIFLDGDRRNIEINNLALVSNSQMLILNKNKLIFENKNLTKVGINIAKIKDCKNKIRK